MKHLVEELEANAGQESGSCRTLADRCRRRLVNAYARDAVA